MINLEPADRPTWLSAQRHDVAEGIDPEVVPEALWKSFPQLHVCLQVHQGIPGLLAEFDAACVRPGIFTTVPSCLSVWKHRIVRIPASAQSACLARAKLLPARSEGIANNILSANATFKEREQNCSHSLTLSKNCGPKSEFSCCYFFYYRHLFVKPSTIH